MKQLKELLKNLGFKKSNFLAYEEKIELKNLGVTWHIKFENKTRKCKFYSVYTRFEFDDNNILDSINKTIACNTFSGKCNRFCEDIEQIKCFINNVIMLDKCYIR